MSFSWTLGTYRLCLTGEGKPVSFICDGPKILITRHIPETTPEKNRKALELAMEEILANGITTFHEAASSREAIALYKAFLQEGNLKVRLGHDRWKGRNPGEGMVCPWT
jgi:predicted amidohydrolase YtcJ